MEKLTFKKNGLIYTDDFKVVVGIDSDSKEFTGTVPNGAASIEEEAFSCCDLKEIFIPDSVTYLGANLFCNSTELESARLPAFLKILPPFLFCGCKSLKKVEMPLEVQDFSEGLFAGCSSLEEIPFRSGIKTLPESVFDSCTSIKSLIIPDSVTKICSDAVANCENLETIVLPAKLEILEKDWISNCPKLKHIRISDENSLFKTDEENSVLYEIVDGEKKQILALENKSSDSLPGFKEPDTENSIITFDENEDETMDDTNIFNSENENSNGNAAVDSRLSEILGQNKMYDDGDFSLADIPQASDEEIDSGCLKPSQPEEEAPEPPENDMESKLKEILAQNVGDFSINDIPVATDEEIAANKIIEPESENSEIPENAAEEIAPVEPVSADSAEAQAADDFAEPASENAEPVPENAGQAVSVDSEISADSAGSENAAAACDVADEDSEPSLDSLLDGDFEDSAETEKTAEQAEEVALQEELPSVSPEENVVSAGENVVSQDETLVSQEETVVPADETENPAENPVESANCAEESAVLTEENENPAEPAVKSPEEETAAAAENRQEAQSEAAFMQNLVFETQKILQQNTEIEGQPRTLFVFAENLVSTPLGEKFSLKLQECCTRLAKIHKFTCIYYFFNTRLDNEKFRAQFMDFIADKDVVVACDGANLYDISDRTVAFCGYVGISLAKEDILQEIKNSRNPDFKPLKLIIQDSLEK